MRFDDGDVDPHEVEARLKEHDAAVHRDHMQTLRENAKMRSLLVRMTSATSISGFHALLCEAKELLDIRGMQPPKDSPLSDTTSPNEQRSQS